MRYVTIGGQQETPWQAGSCWSAGLLERGQCVSPKSCYIQQARLALAARCVIRAGSPLASGKMGVLMDV